VNLRKTLWAIVGLFDVCTAYFNGFVVSAMGLLNGINSAIVRKPMVAVIGLMREHRLIMHMRLLIRSTVNRRLNVRRSTSTGSRDRGCGRQIAASVKVVPVA